MGRPRNRTAPLSFFAASLTLSSMTLTTLTLPKVATLFWLLALLASFTWLSSYEIEFVIAALSSLVIALALSDGAGIAKREWPIPCSPLLIAGGLFWLSALVSVGTSHLLFVSWIYFFLFSALPLTVVFFLVGHESEARLNLALQGVKIILCGLAIYALAQYAFFPRMLTKNGRVFEPFADPNSLASILSLGIFLVGGNVLHQASRRWWDIVLLLLLCAAFFATGSRAALIALLVMATFLLAFIGLRHIDRRSLKIGAGIAVVTVVLVGLMSFGYSGGLIRLLINPSAVVPAWNGAFADRLPIWSSTLEIIKDHLWLGTGVGTFQYYYPEVRNVTDSTYGYMAHNDPLQFAAELGIVAPILFYGVLLLAGYRTRSVLKLLPQGDHRRIDVLAPFFGLGAFVLHAHFTYNFHTLPGLCLAGFVFALWYHTTARILNETPKVFKAPAYLNKNALEALFLVVAFIGITVIAAPYASQRLVKLAEKDLQNLNFEGFAMKINLADSLSLGTNAQAYSQAARIPLGMLEQTEKPLSAQELEKFQTDAQRILDKAARFNPRDPEILVQQAKLADMQDQPDQAEAILRAALKLDPYSLTARIALGTYLDEHDKKDEAVAIMTEGLDFNYGPARASRYMEYFIQTMGMQEEQAKRQAAAHPEAPSGTP